MAQWLLTDMQSASLITSFLTRLTGAVSKGIMLALVIPLATALLFAIPTMPALVLIGTTLIIEYGAAPIGVGLGLPPLFVFFVLTCVALGVILVLFDLFDSIGDHSERVHRFLEWSRKRAAESAVLAKYGIYGLVLVVVTFGFYICPPIAWVCGWDKKRSILYTMIGYCLITAVLIIFTGDVLRLIIPGF
jgi:hypothetical protein